MSKVIKEANYKKVKLNPLERWSKKEDFWGRILHTLGLPITRKYRKALEVALKKKTGLGYMKYGKDYSWLVGWAKKLKKKKPGGASGRNRQYALDGIFIWRFRKYNSSKFWNIEKATKGLKSKSPYKGRYFCKENAECGPGWHFETFYDDIKKCFGDKWQKLVLPDHGMDYKFGPEHRSALEDLLAAKKKGCSTTTGEPPESVKKKNCEASGGTWSLKEKKCICPKDMPLDPKSGRCVGKSTVSNNDLLQKACKNSKGIWDVATQTCKCPEGKVYNERNGFCEDPDEPGPREKSKLKTSLLVGDITDEEKKRFVTNPAHPDLLLVKRGATGQIVVIYGENDPLGKRNKKVYDADKLTQRYFGMGIRDYLVNNESDVRRPMTVKRADGSEVQVRDDKDYKEKHGGFKKGDKVTSAATYHPFHVMFALEEFTNNIKPDDYEWVFIKTKASEVDVRAIDIVEQRMAFWGTTGALKRSTKEGSRSMTGTLKISMTHPPEGLDNKSMVEDAYNDWTNNHKIWASLMNMPPPVGTDGKTLEGFGPVVLKVGEGETLHHVIPLTWRSPAPKGQWDKYVFKALLPKGWRGGKMLTDAETTLARRVGAKLTGAKVGIVNGWPDWIPREYEDPTYWPCDRGSPGTASKVLGKKWSEVEDNPELAKKWVMLQDRFVRWNCECNVKGKWDEGRRRCVTPPAKTSEKAAAVVPRLPKRETAADMIRANGVGLLGVEMSKLRTAFPASDFSRMGLTKGQRDAATGLANKLKAIAKHVKALQKFWYPGHKKFKKGTAVEDIVFPTKEAWKAARKKLYDAHEKDTVNKIYKSLFKKAKKTAKKENLNFDSLRDIIREELEEIALETSAQDDVYLEEELDLEEEFLEET
jgi:hypothetical protein